MHTGTTWSRRRVIRAAGATSAAGAALYFAACGSDGDSATKKASPAASTSGGAAQATAAPKKGGTLTLAKQQDDPPKLDPTALLSQALYEVNTLYMEGLLAFDASSSTDVSKKELVPVLATGWEQPDKETAILKLDPKATWHDIAPVNGRAVTATDVKATMDRLNDPAAKSPLGALLKDFVGSYEATDQQTVRVKLQRPFGSLFEILAAGFIYMMPEEGAKSGYDLEKVHIGSGGFTLKEIEPGVRYVYEKNPKYRTEVYLDRIEQVLFKEARALSAAILSRQLQLAALPQGFDLTPIPQNAYNVYRLPGTIRHELAILRRSAPFDDVRVRQALKSGIDQQEIVAKAYNGDATTTGVVPPSSAWALPKQTNDQLFKYDPDRAKALLSQASVPSISGQIEQSTVYGAAVSSVAEVVAAQLAKINVRMSVKGMEHATFLKNQYDCNYVVNSRLVSGNTGNGLYDWCYKQEHTNGLYSVHNCNDLPGGADQKLNDLALRAIGSTDSKEQAALNEEFQRYLADVVYFVPLAVANSNRIASKQLHNYGINTSGAAVISHPFVAKYWLDS